MQQQHTGKRLQASSSTQADSNLQEENLPDKDTEDICDAAKDQEEKHEC